MTISKKQLEEVREEAFHKGKTVGYMKGNDAASAEFNSSKAAAQRDILKAAAELAQANAKLTYAMSRMVTEKGW